MVKLKQSLKYNISVEGEVCETLYFKHLSKLINNTQQADYKVSFDIKKKNPSSFYKSRVNTYAKKKKSKGKSKEYITYFHVQDIECFNTHNAQFVALINEIKKLEKEYNVQYDLGYTNFSFELWIIIHKKDVTKPVLDRYEYYHDINKAYNTKYKHIDEYKKETEFTKILNQITLDDVIKAVKRGEAIREAHEKRNDHKEIVNGFVYYQDNPDMTLHQIVKTILTDTGIIKKTKK